LSIIEPEGKAVTRTFRLDKAWDRVIEQEAEKKGIAVSSLLENIVKSYSLHYRWIEILKSITFSPGIFKEFLDAIDDETLKQIGETVGKTVPMQDFLIRGDEITPEVARYFITQLLGRYGNWCKVVDHKDTKAYYYIQHEYGHKWNVFLGAYISSFYANNLHINIVSEIVAGNLLMKIVN